MAFEKNNGQEDKQEKDKPVTKRIGELDQLEDMAHKDPVIFGYVIPQFDGGNDSFGDDDTDLVPQLVRLSPSIQSPMIAEDSTSAEYVKVCKVSYKKLNFF